MSCASNNFSSDFQIFQGQAYDGKEDMNATRFRQMQHKLQTAKSKVAAEYAENTDEMFRDANIEFHSIPAQSIPVRQRLYTLRQLNAMEKGNYTRAFTKQSNMSQLPSSFCRRARPSIR
jgi:hypothetical protein